MGSSSHGARGTGERQGYVCPIAFGRREKLHLLVAKCVGVENEWGPVLLVRTGVEKDGGMSVPLRTGIDKHYICLWQSAWESGTSGVQF